MNASRYSSPAACVWPTLAEHSGAEDPGEVGRRAVRAAMQAVYHRSIGRHFVSDTAPAIVLPQLEPMTLEDALQVLWTAQTHMREAILAIARSVPPSSLAYDVDADAGIDRYPRELLDV